MGVTFRIANKKEEIDYTQNYIVLEYELGNFLYDNIDKFSFDISLLAKMNPFADTVLNFEEIESLRRICRELRNDETFTAYQGSEESEFLTPNEEVSDFFSKLEVMCTEALSRKKFIYASGDWFSFKIRGRVIILTLN